MEPFHPTRPLRLSSSRSGLVVNWCGGCAVNLDHRNPHEQDRAALVRYAKEVGVDVPQFERDLDGKRFATAVQADIALGHVLNVARLPALFAQGVQFPFPTAPMSYPAWWRPLTSLSKEVPRSNFALGQERIWAWRKN